MAWFLCWSFPSSSSSSSSSTPKFKYDVFLNFRGDDTRNNFTSHLLKALRDKKIETFIDDEIERGDKISPSLLKAIEESRISIVIFSKGYASSRWCLEELVMILECSKKYNQIVMPVFYGVEPIHIRNQTGDFADAFADHEQRFKDKVQAWKDVLRQAANISGWNSNYFKPESALIVKIVEDISKRLYDVYRSRHDYLVRKELGMASSSFLCWSFPSSSPSSTPKFKYDVFLSFRGDDIRNNFTSNLQKALCDKNISTFIDDELERGDEISPSLLEAIEESRISVVIFSKGYASSRCCLEELVKILECSKKYNQIVMPVFYGVEPIHIRNQTGDFADAFADHEQRFKESLDKVQAWKDVLRQAADLDGLNSDTIKPESALTEKIVEDILKRLNDVYLTRHDRNLFRNELGMESNWFLCWHFPSSYLYSPPKFKYDVFLSFRGDDTHNNFTSHLRKALHDKKIETFIDDELERGDEISPSLLKAIEESWISVVIFSKDYASSRCCLEELVKILECSKKYNQIVIPVFYGVEPIHIRNQTGDFADAFADHEQRFKDKVQAWKDVLRQAADLDGLNSDIIKPESALIEMIVEDILERLNDVLTEI